MWKKAATEVGKKLMTPRISTYRSISGSDSTDAESYYRLNVYYLLITVLQKLKANFPSHLNLFIGYKLLPNTVKDITPPEVNAIEEFYGPGKPLFSQNWMWKAECALCISEKIDLIEALEVADRFFSKSSP